MSRYMIESLKTYAMEVWRIDLLFEEKIQDHGQSSPHNLCNLESGGIIVHPEEWASVISGAHLTERYSR